MKNKLPRIDLRHLPKCVGEYIESVIKKMRYRKKVRNEVLTELASDFEAELKECTSEEQKQQRAYLLVEEFGDVKLLAVLLRRAKKRCRPLWRTIVARTFQAILVLILFFIVYVGWFVTGKPTISVDYIAQFNKLSKPEIFEQENAWQNYEKAIELYVEPNQNVDGIDGLIYISDQTDFEQLNEIQQKEIRRWIENNQQAWQHYIDGSRKPYFHKKYETGESEYEKWDSEGEKWVMHILLPHLPPIRDLSKLGIWQSRMIISQGDIEQAIENCLAVIRCGNHFQSKGTLVEKLVGIAVRIAGYEEILKIFATRKLSSKKLKLLKEQLLAFRSDSYKINLDGERLMFRDTVQHMFTKDGPGGGHFVPKSMSIFDGEIGYAEDILEYFDDYLQIFGGDENAIRSFAYVGAGLLHAGRDDTLAQANRLFDRQEVILELTPYQRSSLNVDREFGEEDILSSLPEHKYFLIHWFSPPIIRISEIVHREEIIFKALITIISLQQWYLEQGDYPQNLDELVESRVLEKLPNDPWSDKPLVYKKTDDGFKLYGVGSNFKDDGGQVVIDNNGNIDLFSEEGDWVFWPVLTPEVE